MRLWWIARFLIHTNAKRSHARTIAVDEIGGILRCCLVRLWLCDHIFNVCHFHASLMHTLLCMRAEISYRDLGNYHRNSVLNGTQRDDGFSKVLLAAKWTLCVYFPKVCVQCAFQVLFIYAMCASECLADLFVSRPERVKVQQMREAHERCLRSVSAHRATEWSALIPIWIICGTFDQHFRK